jgi:hypothetical protein
MVAMRPGVMAPPRYETSRRGVMTPARISGSPPLLALHPEAFADFDLHVEVRRLLWGAVAVLALVLLLAQVADPAS